MPVDISQDAKASPGCYMKTQSLQGLKINWAHVFLENCVRILNIYSYFHIRIFPYPMSGEKGVYL